MVHSVHYRKNVLTFYTLLLYYYINLRLSLSITFCHSFGCISLFYLSFFLSLSLSLSVYTQTHIHTHTHTHIYSNLIWLLFVNVRTYIMSTTRHLYLSHISILTDLLRSVKEAKSRSIKNDKKDKE